MKLVFACLCLYLVQLGRVSGGSGSVSIGSGGGEWVLSDCWVGGVVVKLGELAGLMMCFS